MSNVYMKLQGEPYDLIREGKKTVEVRLFDEKRQALRPGDLIIFQKLPYRHEMLYRRVGAVKHFPDWRALFAAYDRAALGCGEQDTAEDFARAMAEYYRAEDLARWGACAVELLPYEGGYDIHPTHARRINGRDIEIYFDGDFEFGKEPGTEAYTVTLDGQPLALEGRYGHKGHVHFCRMTTIRLHKELPVGEGAPTVTVTLEGRDLEAPYEDYYKYYLTTKSGVTVKGSAALMWGMKTVERAGEMVDIQLSACPQVAAQMVESGATLSVYGPGECAFHIPEHRSSYETAALYVEGFGGTACSITECNVWHWHRECGTRPDPNYTTRYWNENILIHEFGHGVKIAGIDRMEDRSLYTEFQMLYRHAKAAGLWPNTYAISNSDEYFATLSTIWFNVMKECAKDDGWDGTRGPINTRRELYNYDPDAYRFFAKLYPYRDLDGAWTPVPDTVHVTGLPDEPDPDLTGCNYVFPYPEEAAGKEALSFDESYKLVLTRSGLVVHAEGADGHAGLWYDASADMADEAEDVTFVFEAVEGCPAQVRNNEEMCEFEHVYPAYIRCRKGGYLYRDGDRLTVGDQRSVFTVSVVGTHGRGHIECDGLCLGIEGKPTLGAPLTLREDRGGYWQLCRLADLRRRAVFIHGGAVNGSSRGVFAEKGETLTLTAPETDGDGKRFHHWRVSAGEAADASARETAFTMPGTDAVVWAEYQ